MGSNQFQKEYIAFLEGQNKDLLTKINHMKEQYESIIFSKDLNKQCLEEVMHFCTVVPQEIDAFFDQITAAINVFKTSLIRKSKMLLMMEKTSQPINPWEKFNEDIFIRGDTHLISDEISGSRDHKKESHHQLSPIVEESPRTSPESSDLKNNIFKEIKIPLERVTLNKLSEESSETRFKGPKIWRKSLSSYECHSKRQRKKVFLESSGNLNKKHSVEEKELSQVQEKDPLEGPSWLYENNSSMSPLGRFIDYKRRKRRFASVFGKADDDSKKSSKEDGSEVVEDHEETDGRKISWSSEDFLCDTSDNSCNNTTDNSSPLKRRSRLSKRNHNKKSIKSDTESEEDSENLIPSFLSQSNDSKKNFSSDSSDEGNGDNSLRRPSKNRKSRKASLRCGEYESHTTRRSRGKKFESPSGKIATEKETSVTLNDGRRKRKAAPTFKLVEPKLNVKLRRN